MGSWVALFKYLRNFWFLGFTRRRKKIAKSKLRVRISTRVRTRVKVGIRKREGAKVETGEGHRGQEQWT